MIYIEFNFNLRHYFQSFFKYGYQKIRFVQNMELLNIYRFVHNIIFNNTNKSAC